MADVVLSTVNLDVFGGPTSLDVSVDFGQTGTRGGRIWGGTGSPETELAGQDILLYDWYLNTVSGLMFQYIPQAGSPNWTVAMDITLPQYSAIATSNFSAGSTIGQAVITIPKISVTNDAVVTADDFVIRYNIENTNPIASNFTYVISGSNIVITIEAIEYVTGSWVDLAGSKDVHLFISYTG
jgi:hypothetical protein